MKKAKYFLSIKQADGCDYMIGCGSVLETLDAQSLSAAELEAQERLEYYGVAELEEEVVEARLLCVSKEVDLMEYVTQCREEHQKQETLSRIEQLESQLRKLRDAEKG